MSIDIYFGPMFCGKTTLLNNKLVSQYSVGKKCLKIVHSADETREKTYSGSTHNFSYIDNIKIDTYFVKNLADIDTNVIKQYETIGIDEAQFFGDLVERCVEWCENLRKNLIVCGLMEDSCRNKFGFLSDLVRYCDTCIKLHAICPYCVSEKNVRDSAIFTRRKVDNSDQLLIGGSDKYEPVCRFHRYL
jgi:thymidine kinase